MNKWSVAIWPVHEPDLPELMEQAQAIEAAERVLAGFRESLALGLLHPTADCDFRQNT